MRVKVLYFSLIKDKLQKAEEELNIPANSTVIDLINTLKEKYPHIEQFFDKVMVAVNEEYVDKTQTLKDGDTVALIPPVSGG
ncbi:MAG: molybdopterin converting factor subunit 1 [Aquificae bacterium]|nr:molybdopterin converting factor subunit 1 [Aquificota bacterium]